MSNQRVVVLTDEQIPLLQRLLHEAPMSGPEADLLDGAFESLRASLEHPEGITDDVVERAQDAYDNTLDSYNPMRKALEALFPGDKQ